MKFLDDNTILLEKEVNELDKLVLDFISILKRHTEYAIISGYVAILFGRSRGTEDIDLYIPVLTKEQFNNLYQDLLNHNFWSVTVDSVDELYSMLKDKLGIRFAVRDKVVPNMEVKFVKDKLDEFSLKTRIKVILSAGELFVSDIPLQIAYKKFVLKSKKDLEDARHLQKLFDLSDEKINKYQVLLKTYGRL